METVLLGVVTATCLPGASDLYELPFSAALLDKRFGGSLSEAFDEIYVATGVGRDDVGFVKGVGFGVLVVAGARVVAGVHCLFLG